MNRDLAALAELDVLTVRMLKLADRCEHLAACRDAGCDHKSRAPRPRMSGAPERRAHDPGGAPGGGAAR